MKALNLAAVVLLASLFVAAPSHGTPPQTPRCPFGHATLKRVPIVYGLLNMNAELQRKFDALELWPGGCVRGEEREKTVCTWCRYSHEPLFNYWSHHACDPKLLKIRPDAFIADWSVEKHETVDGGFFFQHVRDGAVCGEEFRSWYRLSESHTEELVRRHCERFDFEFDREERHSVGRHYISYRAFQDRRYYFVEIMNEPGMNGIHVHAVRSVDKPLYY